MFDMNRNINQHYSPYAPINVVNSQSSCRNVYVAECYNTNSNHYATPAAPSSGNHQKMVVENNDPNNYYVTEEKIIPANNHSDKMVIDNNNSHIFHQSFPKAEPIDLNVVENNSNFRTSMTFGKHNSSDPINDHIDKMVIDNDSLNYHPPSVTSETKQSDDTLQKMAVGNSYANDHQSVTGVENRPPDRRSWPLNILPKWFPLTKTIRQWKQGDEEAGWAQKAINALNKKLKNRKEDKAELERALAYPDRRSRCVIIPKSVDGRLQVSHKKILPHVMFCRVYRWPDLQNHHELKAVDYCEHPFNNKRKEICINPFHYIRIKDVITMPPIVVPRFRERPPSPVVRDAMSQFHNSGSRSPSYASTGPPSYASMSPRSSGNPSPHSMNFGADSPPPFSPEDDGQLYFRTSASYPHEQDPEPKRWASIKYFELHSRIGEIFHCYEDSNEVIVDGFTDPRYKTPENVYRFCLGTLSNVNRNSTIENTRRHIGKGVLFSLVNGMVKVTCLSNNAVFLHSWDLNYREANPDLYVHKLKPGESKVVFNSMTFEYILRQQANISYESVDDLKKFCTIQLSFIKGWGSSYPRQDVASTPCWLEFVLNFALKWLDTVLVEMKPQSIATSVS